MDVVQKQTKNNNTRWVLSGFVSKKIIGKPSKGRNTALDQVPIFLWEFLARAILLDLNKGWLSFQAEKGVENTVFFFCLLGYSLGASCLSCPGVA